MIGFVDKAKPDPDHENVRILSAGNHSPEEFLPQREDTHLLLPESIT